ncbi:MAG: 4-alpha-glucanotransferase [Peptococcaceae bacterium]|jgi:4-alpha-glucanotransferase|nr:4-alpha-glucanotransferase [Peptococcaceae bacterium]
MELGRSYGLLLHPSSLPGPWGIGDFGSAAYEFLDFLKETGGNIWQILPLGPTGFGESPYQGLSAFGINPVLISVDSLRERGLLDRSDGADMPLFPVGMVDFDKVQSVKAPLFQKAFDRFMLNQDASVTAEYEAFAERAGDWLEEYALYAALKDFFKGAPWIEWEQDLARRRIYALRRYRKQVQMGVRYHSFLQYIAWSQWNDIKRYAGERHIRIVGDMPIYMAWDSADVWANQQYFDLDADGRPRTVAGVPPDYFSETGQLWGNPLYRWDRMERDGYDWWRKRIQNMLSLTDYVRIDHFRAFEDFWEIPAGERTAVNGRWVKGPGLPFFRTLEERLGTLPLIAEDLGIITPEVTALREACGYPGMKVYQFVSSEPVVRGDETVQRVAYPGTHDNDTLAGWIYENLFPAVLSRSFDFWAFQQEFLELIMDSRDAWVVLPVQDILGLSTEARMNRPGVLGGNWRWRLKSADQWAERKEWLAKTARDTRRC